MKPWFVPCEVLPLCELPVSRVSTRGLFQALQSHPLCDFTFRFPLRKVDLFKLLVRQNTSLLSKVAAGASELVEVLILYWESSQLDPLQIC